MRFLGAKVILTPKEEKGMGMVTKCRELAEANGWFMARQFENPANADVHERTTAREIMDAFDGEKLDYFVSGYGTGGTLTGVARVLRAERPDTKIITTEPDGARYSPMAARKSVVRTDPRVAATRLAHRI